MLSTSMFDLSLALKQRFDLKFQGSGEICQHFLLKVSSRTTLVISTADLQKVILIGNQTDLLETHMPTNSIDR